MLKLSKNSPAPPVSAGFTNLDGPTGVAVDRGTVYVADWGNGGGRVLKLPPE